LIADLLDRAAPGLPPTLGEGCVRRFDPESLNPDSGSEFPGAAELWADLQQAQAAASSTVLPSGLP
jgi:hypothetical protein